MLKKINTLLLIFALTVSFIFTSCSKEAEEGTVQDIEKAEETAEKEIDSPFTKMDSPFDYEYKSLSIEKAHMQFDMPSSWDAKFHNARYMTVNTPTDDPYIPAATLTILCGYGEDVEENEMSEHTLNNHAYKFADFFKNEIAGIPYTATGRTMRLRKYYTEDEIRNGLSFVDEDRSEDAATLVVDKVVMMDKTGSFFSDFAMSTTYVKWDKAPYCFCMMYPKDFKENAVSMLNYIASSIRATETKPIGYKSASYENYTTSVPDSFKPVEGAENIYISPLTENTETAGMAVGVFKVEDKSLVTADNIAGYYGNVIASLSFAEYGINANYAAQSEELNEDGGPDFSGRLTVNCTGYEDPAEVAGSVFGPISYYMTDYYAVESGNGMYIVAVIYQKGQEELARDFGRKAAGEFTVS